MKLHNCEAVCLFPAGITTLHRVAGNSTNKESVGPPGGESLDDDLRPAVLALHHGFADGSHHGESVDPW